MAYFATTPTCKSDVDSQDEFKMGIKLWLRRNGCDYAWLAEQCGVTETTVRNWMARKSIPALKAACVFHPLMERPSRAEFWGERLLCSIDMNLALDSAQRMPSAEAWLAYLDGIELPQPAAAVPRGEAAEAAAALPSAPAKARRWLWLWALPLLLLLPLLFFLWPFASTGTSSRPSASASAAVPEPRPPEEIRVEMLKASALQ